MMESSPHRARPSRLFKSCDGCDSPITNDSSGETILSCSKCRKETISQMRAPSFDIGYTMVDGAENDEDEFVDAQEHNSNDADGLETADGDDDLNAEGAVDGEMNDNDDASESDSLFGGTFKENQVEEREDDHDISNDKDNKATAEEAEDELPSSTAFVRAETKRLHLTGSKLADSQTWPQQPKTPPRPKPTSAALPGAPDPEKHLSSVLKQSKKFHNRALELIPRLPLAPHRYWIGVLNLDVNATNFHLEKHFTWMKGNRVTTVETVWNTYATMAATEDFVLLLGGVERVEKRDCMEELDYFNDKRIMLRAVGKGLPEAKGKALGGEIVPFVPQKAAEVVEILDD